MEPSQNTPKLCSSTTSSPLSSVHSSSSPPPPSSPLSMLSNSPSLPSIPSSPARAVQFEASRRYPSPSSTTIPSGSASPMKPRDSSEGAPIEICIRTDGPPPAKRRRTQEPKKPKERTTEYLDLDMTNDSGEQDERLTRLLTVLRKKKRIIVIAGAGISVSAGIPDFRSSTGLFTTLRGQHKVKASGKHLFDASVYKDDTTTASFHTMVRELAELTEKAKPTPFHHMLASMAQEGRLMRLYSQNVDCLDTGMEPLATKVPLNSKGPWPTTIQLHGGLAHMVCSKCGELDSFESARFVGSEAPLCNHCVYMDELRTSFGGKRSHGVGRLRPRIVLYNEYNPDEEAIGMVSKADLRRVPDAVIVVGTTLKIPGVRRIVKEMCQVTRSRRDGFTAWLNIDPEPQGAEFKDCWDLVVRGKSDDVAELVSLPRWDQQQLDMEDELSWKVTQESEERKVKGHLKNPIVNITSPTMGDYDCDDSSTPSGSNRTEAKSKLVEQVQRVERTQGGIPTPSASPRMESMLPAKAKTKQCTLPFAEEVGSKKQKKGTKMETTPSKGKVAKSRSKAATASVTTATTRRKTTTKKKDARATPAAQDLTRTFKATKNLVRHDSPSSKTMTTTPPKASKPMKEEFSSPLSSPISFLEATTPTARSAEPSPRLTSKDLPSLRPLPVAGPTQQQQQKQQVYHRQQAENVSPPPPHSALCGGGFGFGSGERPSTPPGRGHHERRISADTISPGAVPRSMAHLID